MPTLLFVVGFILFILIIGVFVVTAYNKFITLAERVDNGKAQIAAQIESRWDAVKHLIAATKEYAKHESTLLENITEKRRSLGQNSSIDELEQNDAQLMNVVGRLIAISESYPDLKASTAYQTTMESIKKFENHVRHSRMIYNDTVTKYNRYVKQFPSNIVAKLFAFTPREYFNQTTAKAEMPSWT